MRRRTAGPTAIFDPIFGSEEGGGSSKKGGEFFEEGEGFFEEGGGFFEEGGFSEKGPHLRSSRPEEWTKNPPPGTYFFFRPPHTGHQLPLAIRRSGSSDRSSTLKNGPKIEIGSLLGRRTVGRRSGAGQDGTPTERFAQETTVFHTFQGIEDKCLERLSGSTNKRNSM